MAVLVGFHCGRVFWSLMTVLVGVHCGRVFWSLMTVLVGFHCGRVFWSLMAVLVGFHCGRVFWSRAARLRSACELDMTLFPFDQQMCVLKFASWTYDLAQVRHRARPPHATQQLRN